MIHDYIYHSIKSDNGANTIKVIGSETEFEIQFADGTIKTNADFTKLEITKFKDDYDKMIDDVNKASAALKASAKAKLIAGEPLTAAEADTLVI